MEIAILLALLGLGALLIPILGDDDDDVWFAAAKVSSLRKRTC